MEYWSDGLKDPVLQYSITPIFRPSSNIAIIREGKIMNAITFFSLKGGTGKTTLCSSLGWLLAEEGHSVLMIDLDPQGHLTQSLQGQPAKKPNLLVSMS